MVKNVRKYKQLVFLFLQLFLIPRDWLIKILLAKFLLKVFIQIIVQTFFSFRLWYKQNNELQECGPPAWVGTDSLFLQLRNIVTVSYEPVNSSGILGEADHYGRCAPVCC
jgi:hypothetical protein